MKKLILLYIVMMVTTAMNARKVTEQQALQQARQFMPEKKFAVQRMGTQTRSADSDAPFYIFNAENGGGFVIVSGDDRTLPVLGYSDKGNINPSDMPENLRAWLTGYATQIANLDESHTTVDLRTTTRASQGMTAISPLIQTHWDQGSPYNLQTPIIDGQHAAAGCVAIALAQVMYYYQWPAASPEIPAYAYSNDGKLVKTESALPETTFKWSKMKLEYGYDDTDNEENQAVAELIRYVGQANQMSYGLQESGANIHLDVMMNTFGYSKNMYSRQRSYYTNTEWEQLVYDELSLNRPVLYSGNNSKGHQFIVDGYDGMAYFHINWGWNGRQDGYFILSLADNNNPGAAGTTKGYRDNQQAIFNFIPDSSNEKMRPVVNGFNIDQTPETEYSQATTGADYTDVVFGGQIEIRYNEVPTEINELEIGFGLYQENELVVCPGFSSVTTGLKQQETILNQQTVSFGGKLADGKYQLRQIYRLKGSETWEKANLCDDIEFYVQVSEGIMKVRKSQNDNLSFQVNSITFSDRPEERRPVDVTICITNDGEGKLPTIYMWTKLGDNNWQMVASKQSLIDPGMSGIEYLTFTPEKAGKHGIKFTTDRDGTDVKFETTLDVADLLSVTIFGLTYECSVATGTARLVKAEVEKPYDVVIPETVKIGLKSFTVTAIGDRAFYHSIFPFYSDYFLDGLKSISIPKTITTIGKEAFFNCDLSEVVIPEGVTSIGENAFNLCTCLTKIDLPSTLTSIGDGAFSICSRLEAVIIRNPKPFAISNNVFQLSEWDNNAQQYIDLPPTSTLYVPSGTKSAYAATEGWKSFSIEEGEVKEGQQGDIMYRYATGPKTATVIPGDYGQLTSVVIPEQVEFNGVKYTVTAISFNAFFEKGDIKEISLPTTLKTIGDYAFYRSAHNLNEMVIPEGVQTIGSLAFYGLGTNKLNLPSTLTSIGRLAFHYLSAEAVICRNPKPIPISEEDLPPVGTLYVPFGSKEDYAAADGWKLFPIIEEGELLEGQYGDLTYCYATGPKTATVISGEYKELTDVIIPEQVEFDNVKYTVIAIDKRAFWGNHLKTVVMPKTLKKIGDGAFSASYVLKGIVIPNGVQTIGKQAFSSCSSLTKVDLPSTLTSIGDEAFCRCGRLEAVIIRNPNPFTISDNVFSLERWNNVEQKWNPVPTIATLYVPIGSKADYAATDGWKVFSTIEEGEVLEAQQGNLMYRYATGSKTATVITGDYKQLTDVVIPEQVEFDGVKYTVNTIANYAFSNTNIKAVTMPKTLKVIGTSAFNNCTSLRNIDLPSALTRIGDGAFFGNNNLETVTIRKPEPFAICDNVFQIQKWDDESKQNINLVVAKLYVPIGSKEAYASTEGWKTFPSIEEGEVKEAQQGDLTYRYATGPKTATVIASEYEQLTDVVIPDEVEFDGVRYTVTSIGNRAFYQAKVRTVTTPKTLKSIGEYAFGNCAYLVKVDLPSALTSIGDEAFNDCCRLEAVIIRNPSPFAISNNVFQLSVWDNKAQRYIDLPPTSTLYVPSGTKAAYTAADGWKLFAKIEEGEVLEGQAGDLMYLYATGPKTATVIAGGYEQLNDIKIPEEVEFEGIKYIVTAIGNRAFNLSRLRTVSLPKTLKVIGNYAFYQNSMLEEIVIPNGVQAIGTYALSSCSSLTKVDLPSTLTDIGDCAFSGCSGLEAVIIRNPKPFAISDNVFSVWNKVEQQWDLVPTTATLYVPIGSKDAYFTTDGWKLFSTIEEGEVLEAQEGDLVYRYATGPKTATVIANEYKELTDVIIPEEVEFDGVKYTVTSVGDRAFYFAKVRTVTMPKTLKSIGEYAFRNCECLVKVDLPSALTRIGDEAFSFCCLEAVIIRNPSPFTISDNVFKSLPPTGTLYVPSGTKAAYAATDGWKLFTKIEEGEVLEGQAGDLMYLYATGPKTATVISGDYKKLTDVIIPEEVEFDGVKYTVTAIGSSAFYLYRFRTVSLPKTLKSIGDYAFYQNTMLKEIVIPNGVQTIGRYALYRCTSLTKVDLPSTLTSLGYSAFSDCSSVTKVDLPSTLSSIGDGAFSNCSRLEAVIIRNPKPFAISDNVFSLYRWNYVEQKNDRVQATATLYVPTGSKEAYAATDGWKVFNKIEEGEVLEGQVGDLMYLYATGPKTATVISGDYKQLTDVVIPEQVEFDGVNYTVNTIASYAFSNTNIKTVTMPKTLKSIGIFAFGNCAYLVKVDLPSSLTRIGDEAFSWCGSLESVIIRNPNPFTISDNVFLLSEWDDNTEQIINLPPTGTLYVPSGTKAAYAATDGWKLFTKIQELSTILGDVNGDGVVDEKDIFEIVNYLMGKPSDEFNKSAADANGDNVVNTADIVTIVNIIQKQ